jgi:hypothetical protein
MQLIRQCKQQIATSVVAQYINFDQLSQRVSH